MSEHLKRQAHLCDRSEQKEFPVRQAMSPPTLPEVSPYPPDTLCMALWTLNPQGNFWLHGSWTAFLLFLFTAWNQRWGSPHTTCACPAQRHLQNVEVLVGAVSLSPFESQKTPAGLHRPGAWPASSLGEVWKSQNSLRLSLFQFVTYKTLFAKLSMMGAKTKIEGNGKTVALSKGTWGNLTPALEAFKTVKIPT